ncbi:MULTISPECIES: EAL domain-containing protein [unclassified Pseudoalteromonas]|uniref:EAL domain-containing protein n=1 Tax=Pseudoalteromonas sp. '520P1 No. 412' TaxID=304208 RepID=UPI0009E5A092
MEALARIVRPQDLHPIAPSAFIPVAQKYGGFGLSLDDFGTGFTKLNQLRTLPFTEIKIDRSLISGIHNDPFEQTIVNALVDLSKKQKIDLVAKGIELFEELEFLQYYNKTF